MLVALLQLMLNEATIRDNKTEQTMYHKTYLYYDIATVLFDIYLHVRFYC